MSSSPSTTFAAVFFFLRFSPPRRDLLRLALPFVHYRTRSSYLRPLAPLFEPRALHARALLGLFRVSFALGLVLRTADAPARKLNKK